MICRKSCLQQKDVNLLGQIIKSLKNKLWKVRVQSFYNSRQIKVKMKTYRLRDKRLLLALYILFSFSISVFTQDQQFDISDHKEQDIDYEEEQRFDQSQNAQRQMQYMSQRRSACLVLSRMYLNKQSQQINSIVKDLNPQDQNKFITKLYATAVEKCEPIITQAQVVQFFTQADQNFYPSEMFYIFDGYNFYQLSSNLDELTPNQQAIAKFIKQFDAEMEVRRQQQQAQKIVEEGDDGIQLFFVSLKNLSPQAKYLYILIVFFISGGILWYGFSQLEKKPQKKAKKKKLK